ncbi:hypothetical protein B7R54_18930 [Subtercola boreus]|uniref:Thioredoxin domain-containing protein n=1 Tax=Subtercola boreus TaxID=120213 RepID=A0A3E0VAA4_9MICO|nr:TlpA disulfide reductase family protein [Subtercola boreus]RFA06453.1 hypothetical protein B7R54_18930 [Subtercola boreus]TQL46899.1 thiol-disulfide isomerase/thioredoxin [Subtercola boreus]
MTNHTMMRRRTGAVGVLVAAVILTGCANTDLADQYREGTGKNYVSGNGTVTEIPASERGDAPTFSGTLDTGQSASSENYKDQVTVVNFWYAGCAPCRAEAPDLQALYTQFLPDGVAFLGVNVRDQLPTAQAFSKTYGVTYPSFIDTGGSVLLAFSGVVAPNAVPTTLVLDRDGKVAARVLGQILARSTLEALIQKVLNEPGTAGNTT